MKAENANILVGVQVCRVMTPHQISECWDKGVVFFTSRKCSKGFLVSCHLILLMIPAMWNVVQARVALGGCTRTVKKSIRCETSPAVMEQSGLGIVESKLLQGSCRIWNEMHCLILFGDRSWGSYPQDPTGLFSVVERKYPAHSLSCW